MDDKTLDKTEIKNYDFDHYELVAPFYLVYLFKKTPKQI